ncbi:hypothetical protein LTR50_001326 [Elasticomyces elasticus]|nr:hypothetical protein LTR50_001326 [Elasticomyces elasticus]
MSAHASSVWQAFADASSSEAAKESTGQEHQDNSVKCQHCSGRFLSRSTLIDHIRSDHCLNRCRHCGELVASNDKLLQHDCAAQHIPAPLPSTAEASMGAATTQSSEQPNSHRHHGIECRHCSRHFSTTFKLIAHLRSDRCLINCRQCKVHAPPDSKLLGHVHAEHEALIDFSSEPDASSEVVKKKVSSCEAVEQLREALVSSAPTSEPRTPQVSPPTPLSILLIPLANDASTATQQQWYLIHLSGIIAWDGDNFLHATLTALPHHHLTFATTPSTNCPLGVCESFPNKFAHAAAMWDHLVCPVHRVRAHECDAEFLALLLRFLARGGVCGERREWEGWFEGLEGRLEGMRGEAVERGNGGFLQAVGLLGRVLGGMRGGLGDV